MNEELKERLITGGIFALAATCYGYGCYNFGRLREAIEQSKHWIQLREAMAEHKGHLAGISDMMDRKEEVENENETGE